MTGTVPGADYRLAASAERVKYERQAGESPTLVRFLLHFSQGGVGLALQEEGQPDRMMPTGPAGIEFHDLAKRGLGVRVAPDCQQHVAKVVVGIRSQRIALDGLVHQVKRFVPASEGICQEAGVPQRQNVAGLQFQCSAKAGVRRRPVPVITVVDPTHRHTCVSELGIEGERLFRGLARPSIAVRGRQLTTVGLPCVCVRQARPGRRVLGIALS